MIKLSSVRDWHKWLNTWTTYGVSLSMLKGKARSRSKSCLRFRRDTLEFWQSRRTVYRAGASQNWTPTSDKSLRPPELYKEGLKPSLLQNWCYFGCLLYLFVNKRLITHNENGIKRLLYMHTAYQNLHFWIFSKHYFRNELHIPFYPFLIPNIYFSSFCL